MSGGSMQFYKHYTKMSQDVKIRRIIKKFGLKGYGLYNLILEKIALQLSTDSPMPDLEETAEDIAYEYNDDTALINEIMSFMINQGLFELSELTGRIVCVKMYRYLDKSQTRSEEIRNMIEQYKKNIDCQELSLTVSDNREEKNRIEEEKNRKDNSDIDNIYSQYPSRCVISGRSTGKCHKNKDKIRALLKQKTPEEIETAITWYISDCKKTSTFLKNFSTFLNNIPDIEVDTVDRNKEYEEYKRRQEEIERIDNIMKVVRR
jgi:hypothetical protein